MIAEVDKNKDKEIDFPEFLAMMTENMNDGDSREEIDKLFRMLDHEGTGQLTISKLQDFSRKIGDDTAADELYEILKHPEATGATAITSDMFYEIMTKNK